MVEPPMSRKKQTWHALCEGVGCEKKDRCRRHVYAMVAEVNDSALMRRPGAEHRFSFRCDNRVHYSEFIDLDDERYAPKPTWWKTE